ncbi:MAG: (d)CMP kinase [Flavobacteriales bacterium]|nr:(d)CMP kinase [Flavobacteriales bacterium]
MEKIIITLDGHSGCGKSTLAKLIAQKLKYTYVDTGAMYRAITYFFLSNNMIIENRLVIGWENLLNSIEISFQKNDKFPGNVIHLNGFCVENEIRTMKISSLVSIVSKEREIRRKLVDYQQQIGVQKGIVMDGRDIGTVVFPLAEIKLWVTASVSVRAKRRYDEIKKVNNDITLLQVSENLQSRDFEDSNRKISPLKRPEKSHVIDSSSMTISETFDYSMGIINNYFSDNKE